MIIRRRLLLLILALPWVSAASLQANPIDPGLYSGLNWRLIGPFRGGRVNGSDRSARAAEPFLFRVGRRRGLGNAERGAHLGSDLRQRAGGVDRRDRRGAFRPERDLRGFGRSRHPFQLQHRQRHVQVHGRRQDLDAHWARGHVPDRLSAGGPEERGRRLCRSARTRLRGESRARRVREHGRGPTWRRCVVQECRHRRGRRWHSTGDRRRSSRRCGRRGAAVERLSAIRRPGQRPVRIDRWRRQLEAGDRARLSQCGPGPHRARRGPEQPADHLRHRDAKRETGGLYRSDDGGSNWKHVTGDPRIWDARWYFGQVSVDPKNPDIVYVSNTATYRSTDGGRSFRPFKGAPGGDDYHTAWIDPDNRDHVSSAAIRAPPSAWTGETTWSSWYNQRSASSIT